MLRVLSLIVLLIVTMSAARAEKRVALVIGNSDYKLISRLENPRNDAKLMASTLEGIGFLVVTAIDVDYLGMRKAVQTFGRSLRRAGKDAVGLFYYAGHGIQANGTNYLLPLQADIQSAADLDIAAMTTSQILSQMEGAGNRLNLVILDACRNNPFRGTVRSGGRGLARIQAASGSLIAFAAAPGQVARDGVGQNSPYTTALVKAILEPGLAVEQVFKRTRVSVEHVTGGEQTPWEESSLTGDFYFLPNGQTDQTSSSQSFQTSEEALFWSSIRDSKNIAALDAFLRQFPGGTFSELAKIRREELKNKLAVGVFPNSDTTPVKTVLRVVPHAVLKNLDPIWTTAYITRNHGYLIYDTLFAMDENFVPQPQMIDTWETSVDGKVWKFRLRAGLKWHDGANVTAEDCVASLKRWGKRDGAGQALFSIIESLTAADAKTIVMKLETPYGLVLESIGKISSNVPFMMPKRMAETDAFKQIEEHIGSGPFIFKKDEWVPGSKVVYVRNPNYVPRPEPPSAAAGGKVAKVDRVEWTHFPDQNTAMDALIDGKLDYFESPASALIPTLSTNSDITVKVNDPLGNIGFVRFNHLLPPFDKVGVRRAAIMAMKQEDYLYAAIGDRQFWKTCYSVFPCDTPLANEVGSDVIKTAEIGKATAALKEAGYDGTPVVIMQPTDVPVLSAFSLVTAEKLRKIGMKVELQAMDWAALTSRRVKREAVADGGWNMFHTWWIGADVIDPMSIAFSGNPSKGWFGWPTDAALENARSAFAYANTVEEKLRTAKDVQERLWAIGASGTLGQFFVPVAYRKNVRGLVKSPVQFYWNMSVE